MILIIEDTHEHKQNARTAAASHLEMVFYYGETLAEAYYYFGEYEKAEFFGESPRRPVRQPNIEGVILDIHFKRHFTDIMEPEAYGIELALYCSRNNIPCVICTDIDHHKSHWVERIAKMLNIPVVLGKGYRGVEAWEEAINRLLKATGKQIE